MPPVSDSNRGVRASQPPRVIVVIPARYASTRFPGKPLAELAGHPMIEHVYRRAAAARGVDAVIVATDDARIAEAVDAFGGMVRMTSRDHRSGTDRCAEVARTTPSDILVNVQGDEPLIEPTVIEQVIAPLLHDASIQMSTARTPLRDADDHANPHTVKVVVDREGDALYFSRAAIPYRRPDGPLVAGQPPVFKHLGLYAYRTAFLLMIAALPPTPLEIAESLEQLRVLEHGYRIRTVETSFDTIGVDTPDDLARVIPLLASRADLKVRPYEAIVQSDRADLTSLRPASDKTTVGYGGPPERQRRRKVRPYEAAALTQDTGDSTRTF